MEYYFKIDLEILEKEYITSTSFNFKTLEEAESSAYTEFVRTHELYHLEVNREKEDLEYKKLHYSHQRKTHNYLLLLIM